ncbi:flagellar radial spoke protein [Anopheles darlingi]|uniref:Flagellar radial spoke protein n=1 Tax=Anopheles darlingi TaxID=43151 RepID=W5J992_ANODA|nr:flagellar radial spoke protein [Anopheles darlingi]
MPTLSARQQQQQQQQHSRQDQQPQEPAEELLELESPAFSIVPSADHYHRGALIGKPNAIVRPLRHPGQQQQQQHQQQQQQREVIEGQHITNLHSDFKLLQELEQHIIRSSRRSNESESENRNPAHQPSATVQSQATEPTGAPDRGRQHEFSRELDAKLRKLQSDSSKRSSKNGSSQEVNLVRKRPLFITTVPKGVFLQPSKDLSVLVPVTTAAHQPHQQRRLYAFESRPRVLPPSLVQASLGHHGPPKNHNGHNGNNNNDINHPNYNHPGMEYICKHGSHHYNKPAPAPVPQSHGGTGGAEDPVVRNQTVTEVQSIGGRGHGNHHRTVASDHNIQQQHQQQQQQQQQGGGGGGGASYQNVMHDRRVVRGSNYTSSSNLQLGDGDSTQKEAEARRRQMLRKKYVSRNQRGIIGTPPPVRGRRHETVQTEKYLEELFLHPPELDAGCQTDLFLHRPPSPPYVPAKTGCDAATEILDGELFDFDIEVQPIIEVLVSRTLEQALVEVLHEEEIAEMRQQQQKILALREAELAELRRLELEEQKRQKERECRFLQDKITHDLDREMQERIKAAKLLQGRIDELVPEVVAAADKLDSEKDREEFERQITPWLAREVAREIGQFIDSKELLEDIIGEILRHKKQLLLDADTADAEQYDEVDADEPEDGAADGIQEAATEESTEQQDEPADQAAE